MKVGVEFFSRLKDVAVDSAIVVDLPHGATLAELLRVLFERFPRLAEWDAHLLLGVGVEYEQRDYVLHENDEVSIMPPVQGG
ncbi:MAG: molybdopterin synthase sulfur carrier subunit [Chthoniobacter sp.]|nr:molybdopterin synthase sulfur carrier subunit [Chthoniobacter sp.]